LFAVDIIIREHGERSKEKKRRKWPFSACFLEKGHFQALFFAVTLLHDGALQLNLCRA
jgi:hypothetical protein